MLCAVLTSTIGHRQGIGDVEYGKIYDIYFSPKFLCMLDGPSGCGKDRWRLFSRSRSNGDLVGGTISKPKLGMQPQPCGAECDGYWQGGFARSRFARRFARVRSHGHI